MKTSDTDRALTMFGGLNSPLYETDQIRAVTGSTIRPGGLLLTDRAMKFCGLQAGSLVIDIGCGPCGTIDHLANKYGMMAIGIDSSSTFLSAARKTAPGFLVVQGVAETLPFGPNMCDGIICECVLSLVKDPDRAIAEFARVVKPGGYLVMSDMYIRSQDGIPGTAMRSCIEGAMPRHEMEELLETNGFSLLLFEDHTEMLKDLAVQLILNYGSLKALGIAVPCRRTQKGPGSTRGIGYCLLIAEKRI